MSYASRGAINAHTLTSGAETEEIRVFQKLFFLSLAWLVIDVIS